MIDISNLNDLRIQTPAYEGDTVYVKGHTNPGDGGGGIFIWKIAPPFTTGAYSTDNDGTIIQLAIGQAKRDEGRWVRLYNDYIDVQYFGIFGIWGNDYTAKFQTAIDFAHLNSQVNQSMRGSTLFVPNGSYTVGELTLKNGITILGESIDETIIYASTESVEGRYMFNIDAGVININISRLNLVGQQTLMGAFHFKSQPQKDEPYHGGLMNSRISDIKVVNFKGHGIYLEGGGEKSEYLLPNQFNIFENVRIFNNDKDHNALRITGQNGQITFLNCEFDGIRQTIEKDVFEFKKGFNIDIENVKEYTSAVVSFINCTCQSADYGVIIKWSENITFDNCWFEDLGVAVMVQSNNQDTENENPCRSINILNSRFANAAGFGSLNVPQHLPLKKGHCVAVHNSFVNIHNNYVAVSNIDGVHYDPDSAFVRADENNSGGVTTIGNSFQHYPLGKTYGIRQSRFIDSSNTLECSGNSLIFVEIDSHHPYDTVEIIKSSLNAGEYLAVRANLCTIQFKNTHNIEFLTTNPNFSFTLDNGEIATFVKIDNFVNGFYETFQLVSVLKVLS